jgi:hypothetical protein
LTKKELEAEIERLSTELGLMRIQRDEAITQFLTMERIVMDVPTEVPRRTGEQPYGYLDARNHLIQQLKAALA